MRDKPMDDVDAREEEEEQEEEYDENADEDFNPEKGDAVENESSSSEDEEAAKPVKAKKTKKRKLEAVEGDLDSGDEATIKEQKRRKRREDAGEDEDSGGEGGFIRTRAQRIIEKEERKHRKRARDGEVTIDVDKIWADLSSAPVGRAAITAPKLDPEAMDVDDEHNKENAPENGSEDMVTIKRRIEYAGEVTEVEDQVPRNSKEAERYFTEHPEADPDHRMHNVHSSGLQRPLKRPSMFEPNPTGMVKGVAPEKLRPRAPTRMDVLMAERRAEDKKKAQKMTTVQKSAHDWKVQVAREGWKDELDEYGKSKGSYMEREGFLGRAEAAREQAARDARLKL